LLQSTPVTLCRSIVRRRFGLSPEARLIVGIDTLDYTKGLIHKFLALERLLRERPEFRGKAVLLQVVDASRSWLSTYKHYQTHVSETADRINQRFATSDYQPIVLVDCHVAKREVFELLRASDVCYVGSLHEGMSLVSKVFVSARDDESGVLVLSEFAGASRELSDALCINPYASDDSAKTLAEALTMPAEEQRRRMRSLRAVVQRSNAYQWAAGLLRDAAAVRTCFDQRVALGPRPYGQPAAPVAAP
jgi:trehalose 6-phosphate synthase